SNAARRGVAARGQEAALRRREHASDERRGRERLPPQRGAAGLEVRRHLDREVLRVWMREFFTESLVHRFAEPENPIIPLSGFAHASPNPGHDIDLTNGLVALIRSVHVARTLT